MFCEECGSILMPAEDGFACPRCGKKGKDVDLAEDSGVKKEIHMVEDKPDDSLPIADTECPKCEHKKAYFFVKQTRSADESPTAFYTCVKCGHKWRDYD